MTQIIDHGKWQRYTPDEVPGDAPPHAMYARRESDGVDWYAYSRDPINFAGPDTVKFMASWDEVRKVFIVGAASHDVSLLFPAGQLVRELTEFYGKDPQSELEVKGYDPETNKFIDLPPLTSASDPRLEALEARVTAVEALLARLP
jgi:hypothetical protein